MALQTTTEKQRSRKKNGLWKGTPWVKPYQDPIVKKIANLLDDDEQFKTINCHRITGLANTTINNIKNLKTRQPQATTVNFLLRYLGKELVIRNISKKRAKRIKT